METLTGSANPFSAATEMVSVSLPPTPTIAFAGLVDIEKSGAGGGGGGDGWTVPAEPPPQPIFQRTRDNTKGSGREAPLTKEAESMGWCGTLLQGDLRSLAAKFRESK